MIAQQIILRAGGAKLTPLIPQYICLLSNIGGTSYIEGNYRSILRKIPILGHTKITKVFSAPYYFDVNLDKISNIQFSVVNENLNPSIIQGELSFVLHLKRYG